MYYIGLELLTEKRDLKVLHSKTSMLQMRTAEYKNLMTLGTPNVDCCLLLESQED